MTNLFFYGTLRFEPLLDLVLQGTSSRVRLTPAVLTDHAVLQAAGQSFPMIVPRSGARAEGLLAEGLSDGDLARLDFYEGGFAYDLRQVAVTAAGRSVQAGVYFPDPAQWVPDAHWSLDDWERDWGQMSLYAAAEVLSYYGEKTPAEVAAMFPMIRSRAASRVRAERAPLRRDPALTSADVEVVDVTRAHVSFFATDQYRLRYRTIDGGMTRTMLRTAFVQVDAAIVLPYDPVTDRVLFVEQFRMGPYARGDVDCWMLEPVAGMVDANETPEQAARREMHEEAGITPERMIQVAASYPSPGGSTEYHTHFIAFCDLPDDHASVGGLEEEGEDLRLHILSYDVAMELLAQGAIRNTPAILCLMYLAKMRDSLRRNP